MSSHRLDRHHKPAALHPETGDRRRRLPTTATTTNHPLKRPRPRKSRRRRSRRCDSPSSGRTTTTTHIFHHHHLVGAVPTERSSERLSTPDRILLCLLRPSFVVVVHNPGDDRNPIITFRLWRRREGSAGHPRVVSGAFASAYRSLEPTCMMSKRLSGERSIRGVESSSSQVPSRLSSVCAVVAVAFKPAAH